MLRGGGGRQRLDDTSEPGVIRAGIQEVAIHCECLITEALSQVELGHRLRDERRTRGYVRRTLVHSRSGRRRVTTRDQLRLSGDDLGRQLYWRFGGRCEVEVDQLGGRCGLV